MGKVAYDVFELKRNNREYLKEQFTKALNIIKGEDDSGEILFKLNEQMRVINTNMEGIVYQQMIKKNSVLGLEKKLLKEDDYKNFLEIVKTEDKKLFEISKTFAELTTETKRILDTINEKSDQRKKDHGVEGEEHQAIDHHRFLPQDVKVGLLDAVKEVNDLHAQFDEFTKQTNTAVT
jgi:hypothetical protein